MKCGDMNVSVWRELVTIPTYEIGVAEKNPVFLEKRVYQGSSGVVYPHAIVEKIQDEKIDKQWNAIYLENKYLKIMILPELGGRIQMAFDKVKNRHFVYYNQVIKPTLVGLAGPWISGGIEFNWPQHHRPSTYDPLECTIEEHPDGSCTVMCNEVERMFRTKGLIWFTLYPDKAYLEIKAQLYNRTPHPQTFLWWANPAVHVNDDYQSVFPPDVNAVFDHGKRDVSTFPIATGTYYKVDYSKGVDISRYKNIPVPTSYMTITSKYNFVGGYENDTKGGLLHVANHHISPGKKQWTWGNGDFGKAWDRNLTDEDGPYIELMCGVYTDNQPDFSWIMPYEERTFNQYFMPYRDLGVVKNATKDAMVNLEFEDDTAIVKAYCTGEYNGTSVILKQNDVVIMEEIFDFSPEISFVKVIPINTNFVPQEFCLSVVYNSQTLVKYQTETNVIRPIPEAARPAKHPKEITNNEQLYLTGLHLEQYRHATYNPEDYYNEALKRDLGDIRNNNAMGLLLMRKGQFSKAESYFRAAISTLTERNPNPYDGEAYFNLGLCLKFQYRFDKAYNAFYKSTWNAAWQDAAYFNLAQLSALENNFVVALDLTNRSIIRNYHNHKARHLKVAILRKLGQTENAKTLIEESLTIDAFNFGVLFERCILSIDSEKEKERKLFKSLITTNIHNYLEYSLDYSMAGLFDEALELLEMALECTDEPYPMIFYFMGWFASQKGLKEKAIENFVKAEKMNPAYCFPNRLEEMLALQCAISEKSDCSMANYYLGNFWYANRQYQEAVDCWEKSRIINPDFPTVHRNLSLAYYNKENNSEKALLELEKAFSLDRTDARVLMELDQLYKKQNKSFEKRLQFLELYPYALAYRDDLYLEIIVLYNHLGNYEKALDLLSRRKFHPWEGGEGKVTSQYLFAHTEIAKVAIKMKDYTKALYHLDATIDYPWNLGEGKLLGTQENDIFYWKGCAYEGLNEKEKAVECWIKASYGLSEPSAAIFYNDQQPDKIFYQGMALLKLDRNGEAFSRFNKLKDYGEEHVFDTVKIDYFAVSLPDLQIWADDLQKRNTLHCWYLMGLGYLGLGDITKANEFLSKVIEVDAYHVGSLIHLAMNK